MSLNTGDTLLVTRRVVFEPRSGAGNPLDVAWRPRPHAASLEFSWHGQDYRFDRHGAPTVLVIGRDARPVIIAPADAGGWDASNGYRCTVPFYVQFVPDATGRGWTWPPQIDSAFYGAETNLLQQYPPFERSGHVYSPEEIHAVNARTVPQSPQRLRVDPAYTGDLCKHPGRRE